MSIHNMYNPPPYNFSTAMAPPTPSATPVLPTLPFNASFAAVSSVELQRPSSATVEPPRKKRKVSEFANMTDADILAHRARDVEGWADDAILDKEFGHRASETWKHFTKQLAIENGKIVYKLRCRFSNPKHAKEYSIERGKMGQGSSNLGESVKKCGMTDGPAPQSQVFVCSIQRSSSSCHLCYSSCGLQAPLCLTR
ncbi:hypothetical protein MIND_01148000 [Mycena indigotica]|uniref:Uncharacterized protein n=1 Tax=Mycena indigotica TaxID=2126181 RepID=A0A8H6S9B4_9AGAR|nr:uncharacterized protein MIND_01148000 [Mycena indigotica]KAF7293680.1 hypothetical protein MIND_01148000 [Mycena indigotica]